MLSFPSILKWPDFSLLKLGTDGDNTSLPDITMPKEAKDQGWKDNRRGGGAIWIPSWEPENPTSLKNF